MQINWLGVGAFFPTFLPRHGWWGRSYRQIIVCIGLPGSMLINGVAQASELSAARQQELIRFTRQECGFCHGLRLTGGLGSPLTPQALAHKPRDTLVATVLYGRGGTAMPGWLPHLSEADAQWIIDTLLRGLPE